MAERAEEVKRGERGGRSDAREGGAWRGLYRDSVRVQKGGEIDGSRQTMGVCW